MHGRVVRKRRAAELRLLIVAQGLGDLCLHVHHQIATSASDWAAHESGGGVSGVRGAAASASRPAITATSARWPSASVALRRGMSCDQNMVKCGLAILLCRGRFSQIWNNSSGVSLFLKILSGALRVHG